MQMSAICSDCKLLHVVAVGVAAAVECVAHCTQQQHSALNLSSRQLLDTRLMPGSCLANWFRAI